MFKLYCSLIILCLSISVLTNQSDRFIQVNEWSNNIVAFLLMPIYIPYRMIKYVVLNFDAIVEKILLKFTNIIANIIRWLENIKYIIFIKPYLTMILIVNFLCFIKDSIIITMNKILT